MRRTGKCPKCESRDIIVNAMAVDHDHGDHYREMSLATFRNPQAWVFKGQQESKVSAWVCAACGYIEFYADSPRNLKLQ